MPRDRDPRGLGVSYERGNPVVGVSHERGNPVSHHHDVSVVAFVDHVSPPVQPLLEADHVVFSGQPAPLGGGGAPRHVRHRRTRHREVVATVHRAGGRAGAPPRLETMLESAPCHLPEKSIVGNPRNRFAKEWFSKYPKNYLWIFRVFEDFGHDQKNGPF